MSNHKSWLITLAGSTPSGTDRADRAALQAGLDLALAAGAFGQRVTLVLAGKGLELLTRTPDRDDPLHRLLGSAPFYDIDAVYVLNGANTLTAFRDDLHVMAMSATEWLAVSGEADVVINY